MEELTATQMKVFNNMSEVLNANVHLGETIQDVIVSLGESGTPVNAENASKVLTISGVSVHGETVTIGSDVYEFLADDAQTLTDPDNIPVDITALVTKAHQTLVVDTQPTSGDTMTIGTKDYTFVPVGTDTADGEISIGEDLEGAQAAIVDAVNGDDEFNLPHPLVTIGAFEGNTAVVTALIGGTAGNSIDTTSTFEAATNIFGGTHLASGSNCSAANTVTVLADTINDHGTQDVTAVAGTGEILITADIAGADGNGILLAESMEHGAFAGAATHLSGGVDGTVAFAGKIFVDSDRMYIASDDNTVADSNWRAFDLGSEQFLEEFTETVHAETDHTGIDGVPSAEAFTEDVHAETDHTGIDGVPSAEAFTEDVHAETDHTGIDGVYLVDQDLHGFAAWLVVYAEIDTAFDPDIVANESAAGANAAAVGAFTRDIELHLVDSNSDVMPWFNGTATLDVSGTFNDPDIGDPSITGGLEVTFVGGVAEFELVYDTDAGVTKTYAPDDVVEISITELTIFGAPLPAGLIDSVCVITFVAGV